MPGSIYNKNIESMKARFADVVDYMSRPLDDVRMIEEDKAVNTEMVLVDGKKVLTVQVGNMVYRLDSLYDSDKMLDFWFEGLKEEWNLNAKLFMYGLGNGMFVRKFLQRARKDCSVVVHEPSYKIFKTVLDNYDLSDIFADTRVKFVFWPLYMDHGIKLTYMDLIYQQNLKYLLQHLGNLQKESPDHHFPKAV